MRTDERPMWLASLRSLDEVRVAAEFPIDIFDLKEPRSGPLAPVDAELWQAVAAEFADRTLSAALGEPESALAIAGDLPSGFAFAKPGPSGLTDTVSLRRMWDKVGRLLPTETTLVAVAYADHVAAECVSPEQVFAAVTGAGVTRVLLDTFTKDGRSVREHLSIDRLRDLSDFAKRNGLWWTLAGSIRLSDIAELFAAGVTPDCIGVRGDLCEDGRTGTVSRQRLRAWS